MKVYVIPNFTVNKPYSCVWQKTINITAEGVCEGAIMITEQ